MTHDPRSPAETQRQQQLRTARWCCYPGTDEEAVSRLNAEHDNLHALLAGLFGKDSPTLRWVASGYTERTHPTRHDDVVGVEEDLALETAHWLNTGEFGPNQRVLWFLQIDPDKLRAALLDRLGREK